MSWITINEWSIHAHTTEVPSDGPYVQRAFTGRHTITLTGTTKDGERTVTATADGENAQAVAGWQAFWRLLSVPPASREDWARQDGEWRQVESETR